MHLRNVLRRAPTIRQWLAMLPGAFIGPAAMAVLEVVSEGVETEAELAFLRAHGCDVVQGFLYARPGPAAEFERWLAQGAPPGGMGSGG